MKDRYDVVHINNKTKFSRLYFIISICMGIFLLFSLFSMFSVQKVNAEIDPAGAPTPTETPYETATPFPMPTVTPTPTMPVILTTGKCWEDSDCMPQQCMKAKCISKICQYFYQDSGAIDNMTSPIGLPTLQKCYCEQNKTGPGMVCIPNYHPNGVSCTLPSDCGKTHDECLGDSIMHIVYNCQAGQCMVSTTKRQDCDSLVYNMFNNTFQLNTCQKCSISGSVGSCVADSGKNNKDCFSQGTIGVCQSGECKLPADKCDKQYNPDKFCGNYDFFGTFITPNSYDCIIKKCDPESKNPPADGKGCVYKNAPVGRVCKKFYDDSYPDLGSRYGECTKDGLCKGDTSGLYYNGPYY